MSQIAIGCMSVVILLYILVMRLLLLGLLLLLLGLVLLLSLLLMLLLVCVGRVEVKALLLARPAIGSAILPTLVVVIIHAVERLCRRLWIWCKAGRGSIGREWIPYSW